MIQSNRISAVAAVAALTALSMTPAFARGPVPDPAVKVALERKIIGFLRRSLPG